MVKNRWHENGAKEGPTFNEGHKSSVILQIYWVTTCARHWAQHWWNYGELDKQQNSDWGEILVGEQNNE